MSPLEILALSAGASLPLAAVLLGYLLPRQRYLQSGRVYRLLLEISNSVGRFRDREHLCESMLDYAIKLVKGAQYGSILVYDPEREVLRFQALRGYSTEEFEKAELRKEELFLYSLNGLTEPGIIVNPLLFRRNRLRPAEADILRNSRSLKYKSVLGAPIHVGGRFWGVLSLDNFDSPRAFSGRDIELVRFITDTFSLVIENASLMEDLKRLSLTDGLTGLANRSFALQAPAPEGSEACVMIDLDNFKEINDAFGHAAGDECLRRFAGLLAARVRQGDLVLRYAGDEFVLFLRGCEEANASRLMEELRIHCASGRAGDPPLEFSYGVALLAPAGDRDAAIAAADQAMYRDKARKAERRSVREGGPSAAAASGGSGAAAG